MKFKVGLDDGHGINTAGKRTVKLKEDVIFNGKVRKKGTIIHENEFNETIMHLTEKYLKPCGIDYLELAPTDSDTPLSVRAQTANKAKVDVVVSFHANALVGDKWQTKAYGLTVIKHINCSSKSDKLAEIMYKYLKKVDFPGDGETKYGIRRDKEISGHTLAILRQTNMPAVLIELGFMDNWEDVKVMCTKKFQDECAEAVAKAICEYAGIKYVTSGTSKPTPDTDEVSETKVNQTGSVNATSLNVRSGAGTNYSKVGSLKNNTQVTIVAKCSNGWLKIKYGSGYGYVSGQYIDNIKNVQTSSSTQLSGKYIVRYLQQVLNSSYKLNLDVDGLYGTKTKNAVKSHLLKKGCRGEHVTWLQKALINRGYKINADGIFGNDTLNAVKKYQKSRGLKSDGYAGVDTHTAIVND